MTEKQGGIGCPRQHHRRPARRCGWSGRRLSAYRPQNGSARLRCQTRSWCSRRRKALAARDFVLPAAASAARRHPQCVPHPATQGQTRQQVERVERDRTRRHRRGDGRRTRPRSAHDHRDGRPDPPRLCAGQYRGNAAVGGRGAVARPPPRGFRCDTCRSAGDDRGPGRPGPGIRSRHGYRHAAGPRPRRGTPETPNAPSAAWPPPSPNTDLQTRTAPRPRGAGMPGRQRIYRGIPDGDDTASSP